jgi:YidC/Oxa1 family membrane protein insertase
MTRCRKPAAEVCSHRMDRKSLIILVVSFILLMVWIPLTNRLFPPVPAPRRTNQVSNVTHLAGTNLVRSNLAETTNPELSEPGLAPAPELAGPEQTLAIENEDVRYTFTSRGGGIKTVELKQYPATVECRNLTAANAKQLATLNATAPTSIFSDLNRFGGVGNGNFTLAKAGAGVRAERTLTNGLVLVKEFQPSTNYLIKATLRLENRSAEPIPLPQQEWVVGTSAPMGLRDESLMLGLQWYNGAQAQTINQSWFANRTLGCMPGTPRTLYEAGTSNVVWAAVYNQFFAVIAVPDQPAPELMGRRVSLPPPTREQLATGSGVNPAPFGYEAALVYPASVLAPHQVEERHFHLYAGPKEYNTLARLGNNLDLVMQFGFFGFFAKALLLSMNGLHALAVPYGLAIIVITVIIKMVFWPLTQASTRSMKRMQELQPQMKALQEKYKDDPRKMNMKLMEFMRENKVSPLGGCLPMVLQIPVFFGFYTMLRSAIELRGAHFLWACDLSQPDTIWLIPGVNFPVNPLPLVMGATMLWQARLTPASPGMDPAQQKIMKYMPLMFMVFLYKFQAGLTLYWTVQNLLTIAQMKLTRSRSASEAAGTKRPTTPLGPPKKRK